ncbi:hypothetical protein EW093_03760 [Thiospirochaeta perfilievii]|uniref:Uncharacterized protein n=1 Tax=Thiospirochaeta perfilievii TaxID=252967 RepID=A0A5C1QCA4_9SPIO|nr:hypothetical protein [Thiospirochaeta perfilievii]QEN03852.1 hypothetical protein EW093_03760 [Thiospirochaeta perfilievii]
MNTRFRPFDTAKDIINACGLDISYFYDDLIFSDHSLFILQFDDHRPEVIKLFFNRDCELDKKIEIKDKLYKEGLERGIALMDEGMFFLRDSHETGEISIYYE